MHTAPDMTGFLVRKTSTLKEYLSLSPYQPQPYHPAAQDWLPTEAKQGWAWLVPGWETSWEN